MCTGTGRHILTVADDTFPPMEYQPVLRHGATSSARRPPCARRYFQLETSSWDRLVTEPQLKRCRLFVERKSKDCLPCGWMRAFLYRYWYRPWSWSKGMRREGGRESSEGGIPYGTIGTVGGAMWEMARESEVM